MCINVLNLQLYKGFFRLELLKIQQYAAYESHKKYEAMEEGKKNEEI